MPTISCDACCGGSSSSSSSSSSGGPCCLTLSNDYPCPCGRTYTLSVSGVTNIGCSLCGAFNGSFTLAQNGQDTTQAAQYSDGTCGYVCAWGSLVNTSCYGSYKSLWLLSMTKILGVYTYTLRAFFFPLHGCFGTAIAIYTGTSTDCNGCSNFSLVTNNDGGVHCNWPSGATFTVS